MSTFEELKLHEYICSTTLKTVPSFSLLTYSTPTIFFPSFIQRTHRPIGTVVEGHRGSLRMLPIPLRMLCLFTNGTQWQRRQTLVQVITACICLATKMCTDASTVSVCDLSQCEMRRLWSETHWVRVNWHTQASSCSDHRVGPWTATAWCYVCLSPQDVLS